MIFILEGFCPDYHDISSAKNGLSLRDKDTMITLNNRDNNSLRQLQICNALSNPVIVFGQADAYKMDVFFLTILTDSLKTRVLIDESGGNNTGGDSDHTNAKKCNKNTKKVVTG